MTPETVITILSAAGVILVTVYNIVSSKHYREAKQAEIDSLKQQIDTLKQLTSPEVMRHFTATKEMLEQSIEEQSATIKALRTSGTSETPTPAVTLEPLVTTILDKMPISAGIALYGATLALRFNRPLTPPAIFPATIPVPFWYVQGFLVAMHVLGVIVWTPVADHVTYVHPMIVDQVERKLHKTIETTFRDNNVGRNKFTSQIKSLENHFMQPEKSSDNNDSDDSTGEHYE